ncbi:hypothetical protein [Winogradskyella thalassocola]|uniref:Uncharacterized protein n=1 Tax=Winogradskyella thalassocola TaxID=262004 RepID=A0A1G7YYK4_9FLAO|nr:hypothetical protein [Winogradskyella thalassocola]SDH01405.1 hypothetical protein SAMN04489796_1011169 [Winogradskyella thalassocola]
MINEVKFFRTIKTIEDAKFYIYIVYCIYENEITRDGVTKPLITKVKEDVEVHFVNDDFGNHHLRIRVLYFNLM